ncbi:MAG: BrnA antitoxin family protein [Lachnospiraceae bacterium]|nr:BrnA antitoxin family protein [Lachnospiraceae bacterium]
MENENIVRTVIRTGQQPTEAQIREIELAASRPITPDEDAPELTLEQYAEMAALAKARRNKQAKPVVALRISPDTLEKAKATGKGYTGFLSRLLDNAINDPQLVSRSL